MRIALQFVSVVALVCTLLPALLFLTGALDLSQVKYAMLVASVGWFAATPFWMGRPSEIEHEEVVL